MITNFILLNSLTIKTAVDNGRMKYVTKIEAQVLAMAGKAIYYSSVKLSTDDIENTFAVNI